MYYMYSIYMHTVKPRHRPTMGPTLNGLFREVVSLESYNIIAMVLVEYNCNAIIWYPTKAVGIGEWSICGGGELERFYCIYYTFLCTVTLVSVFK